MARDNWIILRGGPKDGWVYDLDTMPTTAPDEPGVLTTDEVVYEPTRDVEIHEDGEPIVVYRAEAR